MFEEPNRSFGLMKKKEEKKRAYLRVFGVKIDGGEEMWIENQAGGLKNRREV